MRGGHATLRYRANVPGKARSYHLVVTSMLRSLNRAVDSAVVLRRLALASLIANIVIIGTGGAVRLTDSGLGCPTWPRCKGSSYVPTEKLGIHGSVEFTNRTLTFVVGVLAVACVWSAWATYRRSSQLRWATLVLVGIPAQAVLGGLTVLTHLNPWLVACHFMLSIAVVAAAYQLWALMRESTPRPAAHPMIQKLAWLILGVTAVVLAVGTIVTGSGPHAGDVHARRTGLDPGMVAQLHADLVMLLIGLSVAAWFALRATGAPRSTVNTAAWLVVVQASQAVVGFVQYFTHLPVGLVDLHLVGAALVWVFALLLVTAVRPVHPASSLAPKQASGMEPAIAR
jgi:heme a synthase